jgi:NACHT domain- and WD repeat-containing protein
LFINSYNSGGPLKYSLEGHQFAIFAMKLTSDKRYIVSVSNKFITFDVVTSDLARQVYPKVKYLKYTWMYTVPVTSVFFCR